MTRPGAWVTIGGTWFEVPWGLDRRQLRRWRRRAARRAEVNARKDWR